MAGDQTTTNFGDNNRGLTANNITGPFKATFVSYGVKESVPCDPLKLLEAIDQAKFSSEHQQNEPLCLKDTRRSVFRSINEWLSNRTAKPLYWLNGPAGSGKSTIARSVCDYLAERKRLGASFFYTRGDINTRRSNLFFTTLAAQLVESQSSLFNDAICEVLRTNPTIVTQNRRMQWDSLILGPLAAHSQGKPDSSPTVIVIDAVDKCNDVNHMEGLISLLFSTAGADKWGNLKVLIASGPEKVLRDKLSDSKAAELCQTYNLQEASAEEVDQDITLLFNTELAKISGPSRASDTDTASNDDLKNLLRLAGRSFLFARTLCLYMAGDHRPVRDVLDSLAEDPRSLHTNGSAPLAAVEKLYSQILKSAIRKRTCLISSEASIRKTLGWTTAVFETFSLPQLAAFVNSDATQLRHDLAHLHSVLNVPENDHDHIHLYHPSFRNFLHSRTGGPDNQPFIDAPYVHGQLAERCMAIMKGRDGLKQDICERSDLGSLRKDLDRNAVKKYINEQLQYSCVYWARHLIEDETPHRKDCNAAFEFLKEYLLYWIEAMAWLRRLDECVSLLRTLELQSRACGASSAYKYFKDCSRFVLQNRHMIRRAPLQIYVSALIFAPKQSDVRIQFQKLLPSCFDILPNVRQWWGKDVEVEGQNDVVWAVSFSPDGRLVAYASDDGTVRIWHADTGRSKHVLTGHAHWVWRAAFSVNGEFIGSASRDGTVRVWEVETGRLISVLEGHSRWVRSVSFSPDDRMIASGSDDRTARVWDFWKQKQVAVLTGHAEWVREVAFSPDGQRLITTSGDGKIGIWQVDTWHKIGLVAGHDDLVVSTALSSDSKLLASASRSSVAKIWSMADCKLARTLEGHEGWIWSVCFSPDNTKLATASEDHTVRIWDVTDGMLLNKLIGHGACVGSARYSADGTLIASASDDKTVRIWNAETGETTGVLDGHESWAWSVAFSPLQGSTQIITASLDNTVRLWDHASKTEVFRFDNGTPKKREIWFSGDLQRAACVLNDDISVWDTTKGTRLKKIEGDGAQMTYLRFSSNNAQAYISSGGLPIKTHNLPLKARSWSLSMLTSPVEEKQVLRRSDLDPNLGFGPASVNELTYTDDYWIEGDGQKLLYLGHEYWGSAVTCRGPLAVIGQQDGSMIFISTRPSETDSCSTSPTRAKMKG